MKFLKEGLGFVGGLLAAGVAAFALFDRATDTTVSTIDDLVASLDSIATSISDQGIAPQNDEQLEKAISALGGVSQALAESADNSGESGSYLRVFSGVFDLPPNSAVDLDAPDGDFASLGFHRFKSGSETWAGVYFNGEEHNLLPGELLRFPQETETCQVMYVGPTDAEATAARFRFRCRDS